MGVGPAATPTRINVKAGTYANTTTTLTVNTAGTTANPVWWRGYKATPGDQDNNNLAVAGVDIPAVTFTTGNFVPSGVAQWFSNLDFNSANVAASTVTPGANTTWYRCRFTNTGAGASSRAVLLSAANITFIGCYFKATSSASVAQLTVQPSEFLGCYFTGGNVGVLLNTQYAYFQYCVFDAIGGDAISVSSGGGQVIGCSFYAPTGNGILVSANPASLMFVADCHFENVNQASKAAINVTASGVVKFVNNSYFNCTANISGMGDNPAPFDLGTLGSSGFNAPASHDFTATATLKAIGFPGLFETFSAFRGYLDNGAVQRIEPAGGGGVTRSRVFTGF